MAEAVKESVKIEDMRDLDDEWKLVMENVINDNMQTSTNTTTTTTPTSPPTTPIAKSQEPNNNLNSPKVTTGARKRNWSDVMKHTTKSNTRRDVCSSFPAKKSVRPVEDSSKKSSYKLTPRRSLSGCNRIGGLSDMDLNDRLHLRKVQIERKSKAEQSRVILENLQSGRSSTVETGIDRTLPTLKKSRVVKSVTSKEAKETMAPENKKIVLKLVEI